MLEIMLSPGSTHPIVAYPNSGPGPTVLIKGDETIGYFGELTTGELISNLDYKNNLNPSMLVTISVDKGWFKFMHKGQVKFISKGQVGANVAWDALYKAGGIYGTNDNGTYPSPAAGPYFNQRKPIVITQNGKTWTLIPKAMTGGPQDPVGSTQVLSGSEYDDLLCRVCISTHPNSGIFEAYTAAALNMNVPQLCLESQSGLTTKTAIRGYGGNPLGNNSFLTKPDRNGYAQVWRGVLVVEGDPKAVL